MQYLVGCYEPIVITNYWQLLSDWANLSSSTTWDVPCPTVLIKISKYNERKGEVRGNLDFTNLLTDQKVAVLHVLWYWTVVFGVGLCRQDRFPVISFVLVANRK